MDVYHLKTRGYRLCTIPEKEYFDYIQHALQNKEWIIIPLWQPQFLHAQHTIRDLDDPKHILRGKDKATLLLRQDKKQLFTTEQIAILDKLTFSNTLISKLDYQNHE